MRAWYWTMTHTRARSVPDMVSNPSLHGLKSEPSKARTYTRAAKVLGKDSLPSPQRPMQSLKPEPTSHRKGFTMSPHGLRLGLTPEPVGPRQGHRAYTRAYRVLGKDSHLGPYGPRQDLTPQA